MSRGFRRIQGKAIDRTRVKARVSNVALVNKRRDQIVEAAVELFSTQGFYRTTVQEVARAAGISTGSIYHYASSKEDILLLALLSVLESYMVEIPKALVGIEQPFERLWTTMRTYCIVISERRSATILAYRSTKSLPYRQQELVKEAEIKTNNMIKECLQTCRNDRLIMDVDLDVATHLFVASAHSWALKYWRLSKTQTLEEFIDRTFEILFRGIATEVGINVMAEFGIIRRGARQVGSVQVE